MRACEEAACEGAAFSVPTIDRRDYIQHPGSGQAQKVVEQTRHACASSGFFQMTGHGIPEELQQQAFAAAKAFFGLSDGDKRQLRGKPGRGYELIGTQLLEPG